eukprot:2575479-Lingulodinium_polyedra.AAC.1
MRSKLCMNSAARRLHALCYGPRAVSTRQRQSIAGLGCCVGSGLFRVLGWSVQVVSAMWFAGGQDRSGDLEI